MNGAGSPVEQPRVSISNRWPTNRVRIGSDAPRVGVLQDGRYNSNQTETARGKAPLYLEEILLSLVEVNPQ